MMNLQQRAIDLHEKAGMPWAQADALALSEAGITDADIDEMIGEHSDTVLIGFVPRDDVRAFVRGILVHNAHRVASGASLEPAEVYTIADRHGFRFRTADEEGMQFDKHALLDFVSAIRSMKMQDGTDRR